MEHPRKKWLLLGVSGALIGLGALFLMTRANSRPGAPMTANPAALPQSPDDLGSPDHELKALAVHLQKKPGHVPVLMRMAELERDRKELDQAAGHLREALRAEPANFGARLELGRILYDKGDIGGAISETEKILASDPKQVDALYNLGAIYANLGNTGRARDYWTRAAQAGDDADSGRKAREGLTKLSGS